MADVLRSIFIFPFTAGHSRSGNFLQDDRDAKISSAVLMSSLISVSVSCTLIFGFLTTDDPSEPDNFLWAFYCLKNVLSFCCVVALCLVLYRNRHYLTEQKVDYALSRKIIFLWIFGLGFLLKDAINITTNADCASIDGHNIFEGDYALSIASHLISVSFVVSELGFISFFSKYKIRSTKLTNYAMYMILSSNMIQWFKTVLKDIFNGSAHHHHNSTSHEGPNGFYNSCFANSDIRNFSIHHLYPFVLPAQTGYSLLATLILLGMMSSEAPTQYETSDTDNSSTGGNGGYREIDTNRRHSYDDSYDNEYYARESDRLLNSINSSLESTPNKRPKTMSFFVSVAAGLVLSTPLLVVTMIMSRKFGEKHAIPLNAYRTVEIVFNVSLLIVVCLGFHSLRMQCREYKKKPITSAEWLLIFSNFGMGMCRTFNIAAFLLNKDPHSVLDTFVFCRHFVVFVNTFWQTILIVQAGRYRKLPRTNTVTRISVENCFMILHILNFMLWIISIFTIKDLAMASPDERRVYGKKVWDNFLKILWPINAFYCFHSSMDLYGLYRRFDKRSD